MTNQVLAWASVFAILSAAIAAIFMIWIPSTQSLAWKIIKTNIIIFTLCVFVDWGIEE